MEELRDNDLKPFGELIAPGVPVVMMSNVDYTALDPNTPASLSARAYSLLREMGFKGAAITDSIGMGAVNQRWDWSEAAVKAIASGADGVLSTNGTFARDMVHGLVVAVQKGELSEARLNEAAARMIALAGATRWPSPARPSSSRSSKPQPQHRPAKEAVPCTPIATTATPPRLHRPARPAARHHQQRQRG